MVVPFWDGDIRAAGKRFHGPVSMGNDGRIGDGTGQGCDQALGTVEHTFSALVCWVLCSIQPLLSERKRKVPLCFEL